MTNDELRSWAMKALEREIIRSTPAARSRRAFQADQREIKREHAKRLRSLAAKSGAKMRLLKRKQADDEEAMRKRRVAADAAREKQLWDSLIRHG